MKKAYIFLLLFSASYFNISAQSDCSIAYSHIVYALSHSESALEANNVTHAKHFAERAREAFLRVQASLKDCQCEEVDDFVYDAIDYLAKAKTTEILEDAYYYANKGKKLADATIEKLDICTITTDDAIAVNISDMDEETDELSSIEYEQDQLKQQQLELERKQVEIKQKIAQKKNQELQLKKLELISKLELTVLNNVETFNAALKACDCDKETLKSALQKKELESKSLDAIKVLAIITIKELTSNYMKQLADCDNEEDND